MKFQTSNFYRVILSALLFMCTHLSNAQNPGDPGGDPDIPIDGGILLLAGAGVAFGVKKIQQIRRK